MSAGQRPIRERILYSRKEAAQLLGGKSIDFCKLLERRGRLTPIKFTDRGQVFYSHAELMALATIPEPVE